MYYTYLKRKVIIYAAFILMESKKVQSESLKK